MQIITREQVKTQLGIATIDTTYDDAIDAKLPIIDAKVKAITRNNWNKRIVGATTNADTFIEVADYPGTGCYDYILDWLTIGAQISGDGMPTGAYIVDIWPDGTTSSDNRPQIEISANATATDSSAALFLGFPISYFDIVAKGVWFLIQGTSTTLPVNPAQSQRMGPVSFTYSSSDNKIDGKSGMPSWFVKGLPRFMGGM